MISFFIFHRWWETMPKNEVKVTRVEFVMMGSSDVHSDRLLPHLWRNNNKSIDVVAQVIFLLCKSTLIWGQSGLCLMKISLKSLQLGYGERCCFYRKKLTLLTKRSKHWSIAVASLDTLKDTLIYLQWK